jgi:hypothetical protein
MSLGFRVLSILVPKQGTYDQVFVFALLLGSETSCIAFLLKNDNCNAMHCQKAKPIILKYFGAFRRSLSPARVLNSAFEGVGEPRK